MKMLLFPLSSTLPVLLAFGCLGADLEIRLSLGRSAYQCGESVPVAVLRSAPTAAGDSSLNVVLKDDAGGLLSFRFGTDGQSGTSRPVEHLRLNGAMLRPGGYVITVSSGKASAETNITLHSQIRRSSFKLVNWGRAKGADQLAQGETSLGFNMFFGDPESDKDANLIRAGIDYFSVCTMSGGHQMDLRAECDWSDPFVIRGGTRRVVRRAFLDRTRPNVLGVHFYDEPGLTWAKDPETGEMSAHVVPWQQRSYEAAFGRPAPDWKRVEGSDPVQAADWLRWAQWKLGIMDAAWKDAQFGVNAVQPSLFSLTQSQYGYSAFSDGYYFTVTRSLPITSGHGGYHDFGPGYFNPSMFLEFARARDLAKPNWYLPTWYGNTTADEFRLEQYLSFMCGLQGMLSPPELDPQGSPEKCSAVQGIVESNHLLQRIGPIFTTLPPTRPPVALLYSLSQFLHAQTLDRKVCYAHDTEHGRNVVFAYLAGKLLQHQFMPLLDEEVRDGTLAAHHRAILLVSVNYLGPAVISGLESFARNGGLVLLTADSTVLVRGSKRLDVAPAWPDAEKIAALKGEGKANEANNLMKLRQALLGAQKFAEALRPQLEQVGIRPPLTSSEPGITVTRHSSGEVDYLFAVNATHDPAGSPMLGLKSVAAALRFPDEARFMYDVVHSRRIEASGGSFAFGPGQMRVFARTERAVAGVQIAKPELRRDPSTAENPIKLGLRISVLGANGGVLSGSIPIRVVVADSARATRYDLYRATELGSLRLDLPLGVNDLPGGWSIHATELLSGETADASFTLPATTSCSSLAGLVERAVFWPDDRDRIFRFFRTHGRVTLVPGTNDYCATAVERIQKLLKPWNGTCAIASVSDAAKARTLSPDEAATWIGLDYAERGQISAGEGNDPKQVGFAIQGPVILLGTPADNPLIKFLAEHRFLPFAPDKEAMPGAGHGYVSWQREAIGVNQESVALIAGDRAGMEEAVGTMYELLAGLEPLTALTWSAESDIVPPKPKANPPEPVLGWGLALDDRITGIGLDAGRIAVQTAAGTTQGVTREGQLHATGSTPLSQSATSLDAGARQALASARKFARPNLLPKLAASNGQLTALAYWGGTLDIFDAAGVLQASRLNPQDITGLTWDENRLLIGDADGRLMALPFP